MSADKTIELDSDVDSPVPALGGKPGMSGKAAKAVKPSKKDDKKKKKRVVEDTDSDSSEEEELSSESSSSEEDESEDESESDISEEEDDDDAVSLSTTEILSSDPLYTILAQFFVTKDGKNIAEILEEMNQKMKYLKR